MDNYSVTLDGVFAALGDPTRRAVVAHLGRGRATVSELAEPFGMALPSFLKHVRMLEQSGLIRSSKRGRVRTCELRVDALGQAQAWLAAQRAHWEAQTDRLAAFVESPTSGPQERKNGT